MSASNRSYGQPSEGDEKRHSCGCIAKVIDGHWELIFACEGAVKLGVDTLFDRVRKEAKGK